MTTATQTKVETLVEIFRQAKIAAEYAGQNDEDGGTCNLDSPAFQIKGMRQEAIEAAAATAGVDVTDFRWFGGKWFWVCGFLKGQANRRARMSRAATQAMRELAPEWMSVCEYCAMD
jgi:hypothetical protein